MGKGFFIMVDGLDGSGKGTIVEGLGTWAKEKKLRVFDLRTHCKKHMEYPEPEELKAYDVILSAEPTYSHTGHIIRTELIKNSHRKYSGTSTAHAFALDREILYRKVILPALEQGKYVFQERGVVTSLVYQPLQMEEMLVSEIVLLPGNKLTLENAPDILFLTHIEPEEALSRLNIRDKKDDAIFETLEFQRKVKERYSSEWLRTLFEKAGSRVVYLDTSSPRTEQDTQRESIRIVEDFLRLTL